MNEKKAVHINIVSRRGVYFMPLQLLLLIRFNHPNLSGKNGNDVCIVGH